MESRPARDELIEQARSALRAGDAASARILLDEANTEHPDDADVLEGLGRAAYLDLDFQAAIEHWQRAYAGLFSGIWAYSPTPRAVRRSRRPSTSRSTTTCPPWKRKTLSTSPSERLLDRTPNQYAQALANTLYGTFCLAALHEALVGAGRAPEIFNTDQGSQFTSRNDALAARPRCRLTVRCNCLLGVTGFSYSTSSNVPVRTSPLRT